MQSALLPTGVPISVEITAPADGATLPAGAVTVTGEASLGTATVAATTTALYVMDVSGSVIAEAGCGGDINDDGFVDTVLDCEIASLTAVHEAVVAANTIADVGVVVFGSTGAAADVVPGPVDGVLTAPTADANGNGTPDVLDVLRSANVLGELALFSPRSVGSSTSYGAALQAAATALAASTQPNKVVVFVSDGLNNTLPSVASTIGLLPPGTVVHTVAVGELANCDSVLTDPTDPTVDLGSLRDIADATSGTCQDVPDPADLPDILPGIVAANLVDLTVTVDGTPVPVDSIAPALPQEGPTTVQFETTLLGLAPGPHEICATAEGTDAIGSESVTECITITIKKKYGDKNHPPVAKCQDVEKKANKSCEAFAASIDAGSYDPDGDPITCVQSPAPPYPLGTTTVELTCTDPSGASSSCTGVVEVVDHTPPHLESLDKLAILWPPDYSHHEFSVEDCVECLDDACGKDEVTLEIIKVTSDEPEAAASCGDDMTCDDIVITSATTFEVRSERLDDEDGRVYRVHYAATDGSGNTSQATCEIHVPCKEGGSATDSGCELCIGEDCGTCPGGDPACN